MTNLLFAPPPLGTVLSLTGLPGGGNKVYDSSPYGNNGTITGATWKRLPSGLWCLYFDGNDDFVATGAVPSGTEQTIKLWLKFDDLSNDQVVISNGTAGDWYNPSDGWVLFQDNLDRLQFKGEGGISAFSPIHAVVTDTWLHIVIVSSGGTNSQYENGVLINTNSNAIAARSNAVRVGDSAIQSHPMGGHVALPEIHNRAWSALEVANSYSRGKHLLGV